ncbi:methyltransferase [Xylogone sp. PMI_703]|nr:methyltransferase [Xylogone sp. PMI_703]
MLSADETEWRIRVYEAIKQIPEGQVTTYKHIGVLLGTPQRAREVGICLSGLPLHDRREQVNDDADRNQVLASYNINNVPWQRVINSKGIISTRAPGWAHRQAQYLRREGVNVEADNMGDYHINFKTYGWFPSQLPTNGRSTDIRIWFPRQSSSQVESTDTQQ